MHEPGLVSTLVPVFNRAAMLREAVASVLAQTYRPIEVIVIDDGSTDDTAAVADQLARDHGEIRVLHRANAGPGASREAGRTIARGEFIQHLDSDDLLLPSKFELQVAGLQANPQCGVSYGWTRFRVIGQPPERHPRKRTGERIDMMFPAMLESRWWETVTPLYRAGLQEKAGPWLPLRNEEDWEYDARMASEGVSLHYVDEWICEYRSHDSHLSGHSSPSVLRDRAAAHAAIYRHARRAGLGEDATEMKHFARELFLLARQCGAAGLSEESGMLFDLARKASGPDGDRLQFRAYAALSRVVGWSVAGKLSALSDWLRP